MMDRSKVFNLRRDAIQELREAAVRYVATLDKENLSAILLSGSVARGDFYPGKMGGMTDLTVFTSRNATVSAEALLGKNEDQSIPFHCVRRDGNWYQISLYSLPNEQEFKQLPEASKYALAESELIWQKGSVYTSLKAAIKTTVESEIADSFKARISGIRYVVSPYKVDRWIRRGEYAQLHMNLNKAIKLAIGCLYNVN